MSTTSYEKNSGGDLNLKLVRSHILFYFSFLKLASSEGYLFLVLKMALFVLK